VYEPGGKMLINLVGPELILQGHEREMRVFVFLMLNVMFILNFYIYV
jgi:hypothetical protein